MSTEIRLPQLGFSMTEGRLVEWLVSDGATVEAGTPLYSVESEKSVSEVESPVAGTVRISASPDETYDVGTLLATIE